MKKLILILPFLLAGCGNWDSAESLNLHLGDRVTVTQGFYKGCSGFITDYDDYDHVDDSVTINDVFCPNATARYIRVEAKYVKRSE